MEALYSHLTVWLVDLLRSFQEMCVCPTCCRRFEKETVDDVTIVLLLCLCTILQGLGTIERGGELGEIKIE